MYYYKSSFNVHWLLTSCTTHYGGIRVNRKFWFLLFLEHVPRNLFLEQIIFSLCASNHLQQKSRTGLTVTIVASSGACLSQQNTKIVNLHHCNH